jgi:metallophosphoesterase (TIGR03767 family)
VTAEPLTTARQRLVPGQARDGGYRALVPADGEQHSVRDDLAGRALRPAWQRSARPLLVLAQLSDTHVMDHQSPGRVELLDRYSDPDSPVRADVGIVGTYRAQELFTYQVAAAMVRAVRQIRAAPLSGAPIDLAVVTGDATDNCQRNELRSYIGLLDGGQVLPDSGDPQRYEGVAGPQVEDERYWHPDGGEPDLPRSRYGFPGVPGVLTAMRRPFRTPGIGVPWYAVHGNHDNMLQGTVPAEGWLHDFPVGAVKYVTPPDGIDAADALRRFDTSDPGALAELAGGPRLAVTPDPARVPVTRASHVREHFRTSGRPVGHGYTPRNADEGTAYYGFDHGIVRCLMLDTVNPHGGWQGSIDAAQLDWLAGELTECAARPVLLFSHHPLETLVNDRRPPGASRRVLAAELRDLLLAHPCVVAWVNGHTHVHAVTAIRDDGYPGGFWQVTTASHIDWPQQARLIELLETDRGLAIACTVIDSAAPVSYRNGEDPAGPASLAALARELAANDWQVRELITPDGGAGAGTAVNRNVVLAVEWPRLARLPAGHAVQRERRGQPELGVPVADQAGPGGVGADERHVRGQFPVQRGEVVAGLHRPRGHRTERGVVVDHRADDRQVPAGIDDLDQPRLARPVHDRARGDLPEAARRVVRVVAGAHRVGVRVPVQPEHHVAEPVQQGSQLGGTEVGLPAAANRPGVVQRVDPVM